MDELIEIDKNNEVLYNNGEIELKVSIDKDTIWLNANDISNIFDVNRPAIVKHIGNIYKTDELDKNSTCSILEQVANDGKKRKMNFYNLDIVISVGYRVNSKKATKFRQWANSVLKNYIYNGYTINTDKLTELKLSNIEKDLYFLKNEFYTKQKITDNKLDKLFDTLEDKSLKPKQGIFYNGQVFDAYAFVSDLIRGATSTIVLIDNYIDDTTLTLFSKVPNIKVTIYTSSISKQLKLDFDKYNTQYDNISIKIFKNSHDRFLILDSKEVYHIGASLKDLGKKWFAFSKLDVGSFGIFDRLEV